LGLLLYISAVSVANIVRTLALSTGIKMRTCCAHAVRAFRTNAHMYTHKLFYCANVHFVACLQVMYTYTYDASTQKFLHRCTLNPFCSCTCSLDALLQSTFKCMHAFVHGSTCHDSRLCVCGCLWMWTWLYIYVCVCVCVCMYVWVCVWVWVCVYVCMYVYIL
jgi:hypothetical protein